MRELVVVASCTLLIGIIWGFFAGVGYGKVQAADMCAEKGYFQTWKFGERIICVSQPK
jgi:hypothetical protein